MFDYDYSYIIKVSLQSFFKSNFLKYVHDNHFFL